jgi:hypothetical protein
VLQLHILAGGLALVLGAAALLTRKGSMLHRRSGQLFVASMLVMGITASALGPVANGLMPGYFVVTALTTVRTVTPWTRLLNAGALLVAIVLALGSVAKGFEAFASPGGVRGGRPAGDANGAAGGCAQAGAAPLADVLRAVHRRGIVLLDP